MAEHPPVLRHTSAGWTALLPGFIPALLFVAVHGTRRSCELLQASISSSRDSIGFLVNPFDGAALPAILVAVIAGSLAYASRDMSIGARASSADGHRSQHSLQSLPPPAGMSHDHPVFDRKCTTGRDRHPVWRTERASHPLSRHVARPRPMKCPEARMLREKRSSYRGRRHAAVQPAATSLDELIVPGMRNSSSTPVSAATNEDLRACLCLALRSA
jgi:hypothetical protein